MITNPNCRKRKMLNKISISIVLLFIQFTFCQNNTSLLTVEEYTQLCKVSLDEDKYLDAIKYGEIAVKIKNNNAEAHYWLGQSYGVGAQKAPIYKKFSYARKCKMEWEKAIQHNNEHIDARKMLISYHLQAPSIIGGNRDMAMELAYEIKNLDLLQGYLAFGQVYVSQENYIEAEKEYQKAIEIDPYKTDSYYYLSYLYQIQNKYNQAKEILLEMLMIKPDEFEAFYQLGKTVLLSNENLDEGIAYFEKYIDKEQNTVSLAYAHWRIGEIYEKLNDNIKARKEYLLTLKLDSGNKEARKALKELD